MKKIFLILFAAGLMSTGFTSCREKKTVGDEIEDVADDIEDAVD
jgi:predicted small secreted protein